jgi:hypothetical protein
MPEDSPTSLYYHPLYPQADAVLSTAAGQTNSTPLPPTRRGRSMVGSLSPSRGCIWALQGFVYGFGRIVRGMIHHLLTDKPLLSSSLPPGRRGAFNGSGSNQFNPVW